MPVYCKLSTIMGTKRVTIQDVHNNTGLSRNTISNLYYDRASRIDYETLRRLCSYFNCQIGDLLSYEEKENLKRLEV